MIIIYIIRIKIKNNHPEYISFITFVIDQYQYLDNSALIKQMLKQFGLLGKFLIERKKYNSKVKFLLLFKTKLQRKKIELRIRRISFAMLNKKCKRQVNDLNKSLLLYLWLWNTHWFKNERSLSFMVKWRNKSTYIVHWHDWRAD